MKDLRRENGVTLMILIVTLIILIILIATVVQTGSVSVSETKLRNFSYEMQQVQGVVDKTYQKLVMDPNTDYVTLNEKPLGVSITTSVKAMDILSQLIYMDYRTADSDDPNYYVTPGVSIYRYFTITDLDRTLDIKNASSPVIINFKTKEVISVEGIKHDKKEYHRLKDIIKK